MTSFSCQDRFRNAGDDEQRSPGPVRVALCVLDLINSTLLKIQCSVPHASVSVLAYSDVICDNQLRLDFSRGFLICYDGDNRCLLHILRTDVTQLLIGKVNSKNCVYFEDKSPHDMVSPPLYTAKATRWCMIASTFLLALTSLERLL